MFSVLPELKELLPANSEATYELLKADIKASGLKQSLTIGLLPNGEKVLVDGHHRYSICQELDIVPAVQEQTFTSIEAIKEWMLINQLGRRNLNYLQTRYLSGLLHEALKGKQLFGRNTRDVIADALHRTPRQVRDDAYFYKRLMRGADNEDLAEVQEALSCLTEAELDAYFALAEQESADRTAYIQTLLTKIADDRLASYESADSPIIAEGWKDPLYLLARCEGRAFKFYSPNLKNHSRFVGCADEENRCLAFLLLQQTDLNWLKEKVLLIDECAKPAVSAMLRYLQMSQEQKQTLFTEITNA